MLRRAGCCGRAGPCSPTRARRDTGSAVLAAVFQRVSECSRSPCLRAMVGAPPHDAMLPPSARGALSAGEACRAAPAPAHAVHVDPAHGHGRRRHLRPARGGRRRRRATPSRRRGVGDRAAARAAAAARAGAGDGRTHPSPPSRLGSTSAPPGPHASLCAPRRPARRG